MDPLWGGSNLCHVKENIKYGNYPVMKHHENGLKWCLNVAWLLDSRIRSQHINILDSHSRGEIPRCCCHLQSYAKACIFPWCMRLAATYTFQAQEYWQASPADSAVQSSTSALSEMPVPLWLVSHRRGFNPWRPFEKISGQARVSDQYSLFP